MSLSPSEAMFAVVLNAVLLLIGLPVAVWGIRAILRLTVGVDGLRGALLGFEETGGMVEEVQGLRRRMHRMESIVGALVVHTGATIPPEGRPTT